MLASLRAELLVLRKSRVAWALVLVAPLLALVTTYLFQFLEYLGDTPATYSQQGTPAQDLPAMLPSQYVIQAVGSFYFTAPFIVLGAVIAGGDWGRGTIRTSLLAGPSRARTFAGQALAIIIACALSVLLTFALAALACLAIRWYAGPTAPGAPGNGNFPAWITMGEGLGVALLIGLAYGALGIALGTICRSAAGGVAAALAWYFLVDDQMYELSINAGGTFQHIYNAFPAASVITLASMFGSAGGGASSATYQPVAHLAAVAILFGYAIVFLGLSLLLIRRRDVLSASRAARSRPAWLTWPRFARSPSARPPSAWLTWPRFARSPSARLTWPGHRVQERDRCVRRHAPVDHDRAGTAGLLRHLYAQSGPCHLRRPARRRHQHRRAAVRAGQLRRPHGRLRRSGAAAGLRRPGRLRPGLLRAPGLRDPPPRHPLTGQRPTPVCIPVVTPAPHLPIKCDRWGR